jgi:WD40 repeat protein
MCGYTALLWDTATGTRRATLGARLPQGINPLVWSPDGKLLATGASETDPGLVLLWDARTGKKRASLIGPGGFGLWGALAWSPDGKSIAAGDENMAVLWDAQTGKRLTVLEQASWPLVWSPDSRILATGAFSSEQSVFLWDGHTGRPRGSLARHLTPIPARCVSWSPDGRTIAVGARDWRDSTIILWDATSGKLRARLAGLDDSITDLGWSPEGKTIAAACGLWTLAFDGSGQIPTVWREGGSAMLWDAATGARRAALPGATGHLAWSPDGATLATTARFFGGVDLWDPTSGQHRGTLKTDTSVWALAWSPDSKVLATNGVADRQGGTILWDVATTRPRITLREPVGQAMAIAWSPDGRSIATASGNATHNRAAWTNEVVLWDARTGKARYTLTTTFTVDRLWFVYPVLAWSPLGKTLATVQAPDGLIRLWDAESGHLTAILTGPAPDASPLSWSPDGKTLACGYQDRTVVLWDPATRKRRATLRGHTGPITALAWSPDGRTLVTGSEDGSLRLWDGATGKERAAFYSLDEAKEWLVTTPEGYFAVSAHGADLLQWRQGGKLWPGARFRRRFERADRVRRALAGR